jgi:hypothetical protein
MGGQAAGMFKTTGEIDVLARAATNHHPGCASFIQCSAFQPCCLQPAISRYDSYVNLCTPCVAAEYNSHVAKLQSSQRALSLAPAHGLLRQLPPWHGSCQGHGRHPLLGEADLNVRQLLGHQHRKPTSMCGRSWGRAAASSDSLRARGGRRQGALPAGSSAPVPLQPTLTGKSVEHACAIDQQQLAS